MNVNTPAPVVSVIILNRNAAQWIPRCLESLRRQTIFSQVEIIFTDNASSDGSEKVANDCMEGWSNGVVIQNGGNFVLAVARGQYLFFVNPDIWLEPECLEELAAQRLVDAAVFLLAAGSLAGFQKRFLSLDCQKSADKNYVL
jgi:GT2 family glycosyltransferase